MSTAVVVAGVLALAPRVARADGPKTLSLGAVCLPPGTSGPDVLRILEAELAPATVRWIEGPATPLGSDDVELDIRSCTDVPPSARITVWQRGKATELSIALTDATPETRSRTVALALAESVRKVVEAPPEPGFVVTPAEPAPVTHPATSDEPRRAAETHRDANVASPKPGASTEHSAQSLALRADGVFRFVPKSSTPLGGADVSVTGNRFAGGIVALGTERSTALGKADLFAVAIEASADVFSLSTDFWVRVSGEAGIAVASGSPVGGATGHTVAGLHTALAAGVAALIPLSAGFTFDGFASAGYGSSLQADANGTSAAGLDGWFVAVNAGVRLPL